MENTNMQFLRGLLIDKLKETIETNFSNKVLIMGKSLDEGHCTCSFLVQVPALPSTVAKDAPALTDVQKDGNHYLGMIYTCWTEGHEALVFMVRLFEGEGVSFTPEIREALTKAYDSPKAFGTIKYNDTYKTFIYQAVYPLTTLRKHEDLFLQEDGMDRVIGNALYEIDQATRAWREIFKPKYFGNKED